MKEGMNIQEAEKKEMKESKHRLTCLDNTV